MKVPANVIKDKLEILIVDDMKDNLLALNALLERDDVIIHQALSGNLALELLMKHDFCLALLDVQMPGMSGFELAEFMRGSKKTKNIPIIFVTATANEKSFSFKGYESGAVDFLLKPLDPHAVKSKVNIFVSLYRQTKELRAQLEMITGLVEELKHAKTGAEKANCSKTQFLANMSHEIRTPVGAILGFIDLMKNPGNTVEQNQNYNLIVERNSRQLLRLIDDILDLSKVEAGMMTTEAVEFSLSDMLGDFTSIMNFKAEEKGIEFRFSTTTLIPDVICSDPVRLRQILTNIVGNALKFTERGHVELKIEFQEPILTFTVQDTGLGISNEHVAKLFRPFSQADTSTTRRFGGTGLGLALSRRLAESLGGRLELTKSDESLGSIFRIEVSSPLLPQARLVTQETLTTMVISPTNKKKTKPILVGLKVLLVEDSPDNQMLIKTYLGNEGAQVTVASDGAQGIELAITGDFDVVLMDIQMPVLDGHGATKKLRQLKYTQPIIALTAHAMKEERARCLESGFTDFLTKPIQKDVLFEILSKYVPGFSLDPQAAAPFPAVGQIEN
jgi:two-component system, sensor histidine kinase